MEKKCFKCGQIKSINEYYVHKQMGDGYLNKCKICTKNDVKAHYSKKSDDVYFIEQERKRGRDKYHRLYSHKPQRKVLYSKKKEYLLKFPEKYKAKIILGNKNKLYGFDRHHWSYNEEHYCDIIHLTPKNHSKVHRFLVYDNEHLLFRRYDMMTLLDTKDKHLNFINYCIENLDD